MKTRSKKLASTPKTTLATLAAALLLAVFAFTFSHVASQAAFADEDARPDAQKETTITLKTTQLKSLDGVDSEYALFYDTEQWDKAPYAKDLDADAKDKVTIGEAQDKAAGTNAVEITATKDVDIDMVLVQIGTEYLESAVPDGTLAKDKTYQIVVPKDAKIMHVALYTDKGGTKDGSKKEAKDGDAKLGAEGDAVAKLGADGNDPNAENADTADPESDDLNADDTEIDSTKADGTETDGTEADGANVGDTEAGDSQPEEPDTGDDAANDGTAEAPDENAAETPDQNAAKDPDANVNGAAPAETTATTFSISVGKTDAKTGGALAGAEFQLKDSSGTVVKSWTSSADSAQLVEGLSADQSYVLSETKAPAGYNREKDINVRYDAKSDKVLIDQGGSSVALDKNNGGASILNVKDITGKSSAQTSVSTTPKTGDQLNLPLIIGILIAVIAVAAAVAVRARKKSKS
jgi:LPXTG-motif cell wall-anchored protein